MTKPNSKKRSDMPAPSLDEEAQNSAAVVANLGGEPGPQDNDEVLEQPPVKSKVSKAPVKAAEPGLGDIQNKIQDILSKCSTDLTRAVLEVRKELASYDGKNKTGIARDNIIFDGLNELMSISTEIKEKSKQISLRLNNRNQVENFRKGNKN